VIARSQNGDAKAIAALAQTARYLGIGLSMIINTLNPAQIFLGGEIADAWPQIEPIVRAALSERTLTADAAATPIVPEPASSLPRLRGATALVAAPTYAAPQVA